MFFSPFLPCSLRNQDPEARSLGLRRPVGGLLADKNAWTSFFFKAYLFFLKSVEDSAFPGGSSGKERK